MTTKKSSAKKTATKSLASKSSASKSSASKSSANKTASKKNSTRKYSAAASKSVEREMKAMEQGKLKSGSGARVTNPKQAIAIGLSEARKAGDKVPSAPKK